MRATSVTGVLRCALAISRAASCAPRPAWAWNGGARARDPPFEAYAGRGAHLAARGAEPSEIRGALQARRPDPGALARELGEARPGAENQRARKLSAASSRTRPR